MMTLQLPTKLRAPRRVALAAMLTVLLAGCQPLTPDSNVLATATPSSAVAPAEMQGAELGQALDTAQLDATAAAMVNTATLELATTLGVTPDDVEVVTVYDVMWADASLGCPEPDMMYAQVLTPGYRVELAVDGERYVYHTGSLPGSPVVTCPE